MFLINMIAIISYDDITISYLSIDTMVKFNRLSQPVIFDNKDGRAKRKRQRVGWRAPEVM